MVSLWATLMLNGCSETSRSLEDTSEGTYTRAATSLFWPPISLGSALLMLHDLSPVLCGRSIATRRQESGEQVRGDLEADDLDL